jgi:hypothetical protein
MLTKDAKEWTIVILGNWNRAIFNPMWLKDNDVFHEESLKLEFSTTLGMVKMTGDSVMLIPTNDSLVVAPTEVTDENLKRVEEVAVKLLEKLPHTPISKVGINLGFNVTDCDAKLLSHFPNPDNGKFIDYGLTPKNQIYQWSFDFEGLTLTIFFTLLSGNMLNVKFNYESVTPTSSKAIDAIRGNISQHFEKTKSLLKTIYGLEIEE